MPVRDDYEFVHIAGAATTVIVGSACKLICVDVNTAGGLATVYNAATSLTASTTNTVGALGSGIIAGVYLEGGKKLATGLTVVTLGASTDITVVYANA